jgi:hypothetical protein
LDARRYGCIRGDHCSDHRFEACGDTIAGKGGVEAGIKPSKGGCCRSSCADRAAAQRIYGVLDGGGQRQQVAKVHSHVTKQINNDIVRQLYLDIPTQATTPATQCKRHILHVEARTWPFNGQTARNQTKPRTPLHSPFGFGAHRRSGITNGPSRRITSDHESLPNYPDYYIHYSLASALTSHTLLQQSARGLRGGGGGQLALWRGFWVLVLVLGCEPTKPKNPLPSPARPSDRRASLLNPPGISPPPHGTCHLAPLAATGAHLSSVRAPSKWSNRESRGAFEKPANNGQGHQQGGGGRGSCWGGGGRSPQNRAQNPEPQQCQPPGAKRPTNRGPDVPGGAESKRVTEDISNPGRALK